MKDSIITKLFSGLDRAGVQAYQRTLLGALQEYEQRPEIIPPRNVTTTEYGCTHLFMCSTGTRVGMKVISGSRGGFKGLTTVLDRETGDPVGVINGATLTAFRTALCNTLPLVKCFPLEAAYSDETLVVFGVGDQGVWHVKLALILYPGRFSKVVVVNRTVAKAEALCRQFQDEHPQIRFQASPPSTGAADDPLLREFEKATVVFTCIPTSTPTVTEKLLARCQGRCFVGAIGSYKPHMTEIEGSVLTDMVIRGGGKIIVDSIDHCSHEAGELIINRIDKDHLVQITSLYSPEHDHTWLSTGKVVVCKLVGLCIMDVWVGSHCLDECSRQGLGIDIPDF